MGDNGNGSENGDRDGKQKGRLNFGKMSLKIPKLNEGLTKTFEGLTKVFGKSEEKQKEERKKKLQKIQEQIDKFKSELYDFLIFIYYYINAELDKLDELDDSHTFCPKEILEEITEEKQKYDKNSLKFYKSLYNAVLYWNVSECDKIYNGHCEKISKIFISFLNGLLKAMETDYQFNSGYGLPFDKLKFQKKLQEYEDLLDENKKYEIIDNSIKNSQGKQIVENIELAEIIKKKNSQEKQIDEKKIKLIEIIKILETVSYGFSSNLGRISSFFYTKPKLNLISGKEDSQIILEDFFKYVIIILTYLQDEEIEKNFKTYKNKLKFLAILDFLDIKYEKSNSPAEGGKRKQKRNFSVKKKTKTKTSRKKRSRKLKR